MASLAERISLIVQSKTSALIEMFEDPAEMIDQVIINARKDYSKSLNESAEIFANEKKTIEDLNTFELNVKKWNNIAEQAVKAGNDDDAIQALNNASMWEEKVNSQKPRVAKAKEQANKQRVQLNDMQEKIRDMESKSADIKADMAQAKVAKASAKLSGKIGSNSFAQFDRLAEKAAQERRKAEAIAEFNEDPVGAANVDLEKKYSGVSTVSADARLQALKEKLGKA